MLGNISNFPPVNFLLVSQRTPVSTHYRWGALTLTWNHFGFLHTNVFKTLKSLGWNISFKGACGCFVSIHTGERQLWKQLNYGILQNSPKFSTEAFQNICPPTRSWALHFLNSGVKILRPFPLFVCSMQRTGTTKWFNYSCSIFFLHSFTDEQEYSYCWDN